MSKRGKSIRYIYPTHNSNENYQILGKSIKKPNIANVYCTFHSKGQSRNHLHMQMWINGDDDGFANTIAYQKKQTGKVKSKVGPLLIENKELISDNQVMANMLQDQSYLQ